METTEETPATHLISHDKTTKRIKYGGRIKGTPNRITNELRLILAETLSKEIARLPEMLEELPTQSRLYYLLKLSRLVMPEPRNDWDSFCTRPMGWPGDYQDWSFDENENE